MTEASINSFTASRLASLGSRDRHRALVELSRRDSARVDSPRGELISFACNDYLGLSRHPEVIAAALDATLRCGVGSGASRLISGNHAEYKALETQLAALKATQDAVVFGSGYLANLGVISALAGKRDLILMDEYSHSCLRSGAQLAGSRVLQFRHNSAAHCRELLQAHRTEHRHVVVITEGVFSMDGDVAPLAELAEQCDQHDAWLLCDDAHGLGVLGNGRGTAAQAGIAERVPLQVGTLSKAAGGYGGFVCASATVCDYLRNRARTFIYSTGLPPGVVAAAAKALEIIAASPELTARPLQHARRFTRSIGLPDADSAIVPLIVGESSAALALSEQLQDDGIFVPAVRPPTVPQGTARLRIAFSAAHSNDDIDALTQALRSRRNEVEAPI